jgi:hypothetical protein
MRLELWQFSSAFWVSLTISAVSLDSKSLYIQILILLEIILVFFCRWRELEWVKWRRRLGGKLIQILSKGVLYFVQYLGCGSNTELCLHTAALDAVAPTPARSTITDVAFWHCNLTTNSSMAAADMLHSYIHCTKMFHHDWLHSEKTVLRTQATGRVLD